jgi:hypothetical protein
MRIGLDFDGVLHSYVSGWTDRLEPQDAPVEGAQQFVKWLLDMGAEVVIITARIREQGDANEQAIRDWLNLHNFPEIQTVTNIKVPCALYIDDRGWRFEGDFKPLYALFEKCLDPGTWVHPPNDWGKQKTG